MLKINVIEDEIGKALVNKGIRESQNTGKPVLVCVNQIWQAVYGKNHKYQNNNFKIEPVKWEEIFKTLC